jgi:hypothetical protein
LLSAASLLEAGGVVTVASLPLVEGPLALSANKAGEKVNAVAIVSVSNVVFVFIAV